MELIFESRTNFTGFKGSLHFVQWKPVVHQEPLIVPDTFVDGRGVYAYGSVLHENGTWRIWYQAAPRDWTGTGDIAAVAYAESKDGYEWVKRPLGLVKHGPDDNHLCDLALHSPSIFKDTQSPPSHQYRATGCGRQGLLARPGLRTGFYAAHSADGLHWELDANEPQWEGLDVASNVYHPGRRQATVAMKKVSWNNRMMRRGIRTATYQDGRYGKPVIALYPDEYDDVAAAQRGHFTSDYYGMGMMPAGQGMVGFIWNFWHDLPYFNLYPYGVHGHSDITLAYQENEGDRWLHMPGRPNFISRQDLPWTSKGWITSTSSPVLVGDEHRLYFAGLNIEHFRFRDAQGKPVERWEQWIKEHGISGMTFASWPKYRLFGFDTPSEASFNIQLEGLEGPFEIHINYKARTTGRVFASLDQGDQHSAEACISLTGDELSAPLTWKGGRTLYPPENGKMTLTIHLQMAAIYAYEIVKV